MDQSDLLHYVVQVFESLGLRYFVTGSTATIVYGEPRFTNDIDIVVDLPASVIHEFCSRFPHDEFYISDEAVSDAVRHRSQFNIIHPASGLKVDVIVPDDGPFNRSRFERARRIRVSEDTDVSFTSPEDAILKKMDFYRQGGSQKHLRDIAGVLKTSRGQLDLEYVEQWAQRMGLLDIWHAILQGGATQP